MYIFTGKFMKTGKKNKHQKQLKSLNFAESKVHHKINVHNSFDTDIFVVVYLASKDNELEAKIKLLGSVQEVYSTSQILPFK